MNNENFAEALLSFLSDVMMAPCSREKLQSPIDLFENFSRDELKRICRFTNESLNLSRPNSVKLTATKADQAISLFKVIDPSPSKSEEKSTVTY
ncbi:hypothetical protein GEMRC1_005274 [Eukaryota sp. GEM-RC1]